MKVSAIMPCRNEEKYLRETLQSLLKQTRMPDELIYNSCSTDNSNEIMESFIQDFEDLGCHVVMQQVDDGFLRFNEAVDTSTGDIIFTCCANDIYEPEFISKLAGVLESDPDIDIAYPWWTEFNDAGEKLFEFQAPEDYLTYLKTAGNCIAGHSLYTRKMHYDVGGVIAHEISKQPEDYNLWLRAIAIGYKAKLVPEYLLKWRRHVGQMSSLM